MTDADCGPSTISGQVVCYTGSDDQAGYYWDYPTDVYQLSLLPEECWYDDRAAGPFGHHLTRSPARRKEPALGPLAEYGQGVLLITHVNTQDDADKNKARHAVSRGGSRHWAGLPRYFSYWDADVACRQLGYARHSSYTYVDEMAENLIHHHDDHHLAHTDSEISKRVGVFPTPRPQIGNRVDRPLICDRCGNYENFLAGRSWWGVQSPRPRARGFRWEAGDVPRHGDWAFHRMPRALECGCRRLLLRRWLLLHLLCLLRW